MNACKHSAFGNCPVLFQCFEFPNRNLFLQRCNPICSQNSMWMLWDSVSHYQCATEKIVGRTVRLMWDQTSNYYSYYFINIALSDGCMNACKTSKCIPHHNNNNNQEDSNNQYQRVLESECESEFSMGATVSQREQWVSQCQHMWAKVSIFAHEKDSKLFTC